MNPIFVRFVIICLVFCGACSRAPKAKNLVAEIEFKAKVDSLSNAADGATAIFSGKTNLPPGSRIEMRFGLKSEPNGPGGSSRITVAKDGTFRSSRFGPFPPGEYEAEAVFDPRNQADEILRVVGENAESLKGPLIQEFAVGKIKWYVATSSISVMLGTVKDTQASIAKSKKELQETARKVVDLHDAVSQNYAQNDLGSWVTFARTFQPESAKIMKGLDAVRNKDMNWLACFEGHEAVRKLFFACVPPVGRNATGPEQKRINQAEEEWRAVADSVKAILEP
jgi:hypothetical protein